MDPYLLQNKNGSVGTRGSGSALKFHGSAALGSFSFLTSKCLTGTYRQGSFFQRMKWENDNKKV